jgi:hypothetical protein
MPIRRAAKRNVALRIRIRRSGSQRLQSPYRRIRAGAPPAKEPYAATAMSNDVDRRNTLIAASRIANRFAVSTFVIVALVRRRRC